MEELMKALGVKSVNDMTLEEIKTRIDDYQDFNDSLEEISETLEINTGVYMDLEFIYEMHKETIEKDYRERYEHNLRFYERNPRALTNVLIAMVMRTHAKIGEISFMLDSDLDGLQYREAEILDDMEQSQIADSENCEFCGGNCDDCYISGCCSSAVSR